jgi:nicotinate phosphoribosyltransferase
MITLNSRAALYTDFYQLTMAQGYFFSGRSETKACFDYFYRENPFGGGYVLFAGIGDVAEVISTLRFEEEEVEYLRKQGFRTEFLDYLRRFRFRGSLHSVREGEVVFPLEPLVRVEGTLIEGQLIETLLLNMVNFQSLVATKASRLRTAAGNRRLVDFGLRRAQGLGGIHASRAAIIGGVDATSNVYSAYMYDLEPTGTQAHSWIQSFDDELTSFRTFAEMYPTKCVLLVDTYNTLRSGVPNAITVAKELEQRGHKLQAVRLDSGDLAYLSKHTRAMLDNAGLSYVKIVVSNQLDEYVIRSLLQQEAPIDTFGVGTRLAVAYDSPALEGVYKLAASDGKPRLKFSDNFNKMTLPGTKKILRYSDGQGMFYSDGIVLSTESSVDNIVHPFFSAQHSRVDGMHFEEVMKPVVVEGRLAHPLATVNECAAYARERLSHLSAEHKRFENPHTYKVGVSVKLLDLRSHLYDAISKKIN